MRKSTKRTRIRSVQKPREPRLTERQVESRVFRRLAKYKDLSALEQFAMFMGMAQVLEFGLKQLLVRLFNYGPERMERWTLGRTIRELEQSGLRPDYIGLLNDLLDYRNYIAHDYLADEAMLRRIVGGNLGRLQHKFLERGIFKVEHAVVIYDWLEKHDLWLARNTTAGAQHADWAMPPNST
jgi:hypothetical protein